MTEYYLVDVKSIASNVPRSNFNVDELEQLAQSILAAGGLLAPLVLKQTGPENYQVLAGHREYYAALRAKEINPRQGEMVNAFIVPPKQEDAAIAQLDRLTSQKVTISTPDPSPGNTSGTDLRLTNLESRLDSTIRDLKQAQEREVKRLEERLSAIERQVPQKVEALDAFNNLSVPELVQKLSLANVRGRTAERIINSIEKERKKAPFTSFSNVVQRIDGLGDKRMLSILDTWGGMY